MSESTTKTKRQKPSITPIGIAAYPRLLGEPDKKFKAEGVWSVKLKFPSLAAPGVQEMIDKFESAIAKAKQEAAADAAYMQGLKKKGKKLAECDRSFFVDDETGEVSVNFKMTASGVSKKDNKPWERKPAVFDAAGVPMAVDTRIGSGSSLKVAYTFEPFYTALGYGCSIRLEAAQVVKLVEWGQGTAETYGFGNEANPLEDEDGEETATAPSTEDTSGDF